MRKFLIALGLLVGFVGISQAALRIEDTKWVTVLSSETVNATAVVVSSAVAVGEYEDFSIMVEVVSGSSADVKVEYQVINSNNNYMLLVASAPANGDLQTLWVTPATNGEVVASVTDDYVDVLEPIPTKWLRIQVTGNGGNGADTVISVYICGYAER